MTWTDTKITATELGKTFVVAQPAFVLGLYAGPELNEFGAALLDWWLKNLPPEAKLYFLGSTSHHFKELNSRALARVRTALANLSQKGQFYMIKDAPEFALGQHSLELSLGAKPGSNSPNTVHVAFPVDHASRVGADTVVQEFNHLVEQFPIRHATAGYGFDLVWGREWEMAALPTILATARRYLALDIRERLLEGTLLNMVKGPGWLTYLNNELIDKLGGSQAMDSVLSSAVERVACTNGMILRAGPTPPIADRNRQAPDAGPLREVSQFLKPIRKSKWLATNLFRVDPADANAWFSRLDP